MATIKDVAKVAGVSIATVSRVIHNKGKVGDVCRARVKKVIVELGYRPNSNASALASNTSNTIGVVTPKLSMPFFGSLASGVENGARENNFKLLMANSLYETESELKAIESLRENNCKAIILHSEYSDEKTLIKLAKEILDSMQVKWIDRKDLRKINPKERDIYYEHYDLMVSIRKRKLAKIENLPPAVDVTDFVDHIDYMVKKIGLKHVGISSDFDGGGGIEGWSDASETFNVTLELVKRGYTEDEIEMLWSGNLLRVLDEVEAIAKTIN